MARCAGVSRPKCQQGRPAVRWLAVTQLTRTLRLPRTGTFLPVPRGAQLPTTGRCGALLSMATVSPGLSASLIFFVQSKVREGAALPLHLGWWGTGRRRHGMLGSPTSDRLWNRHRVADLWGRWWWGVMRNKHPLSERRELSLSVTVSALSPSSFSPSFSPCLLPSRLALHGVAGGGPHPWALSSERQSPRDRFFSQSGLQHSGEGVGMAQPG